MKWVRIENGIVKEIIPNDALPVEKWYGAEFAAQCVEAPDEVEQRWTYDSEHGTFSEPQPPVEPGPEPVDPLTQLQLAMAELAETMEASTTETQLAVAELAELMAAGEVSK